ncbi:sulfate ABC transporter substrate-binding protein [Clostridium sp. HBUAS56010]|uniref:sulfate ABC transporter substrate-binding protein n=1 Tax=Clostridium sp. HBUAS56010 TaxID=2571127 RepID=UPI0011784F28|nr:sulfate ABC transporter substrate-binding protein [Clostridium sp. HBUAS56010]
MRRLKKLATVFLLPVLALSLGACARETGKDQSQSQSVTITNVSYDPTREFYLAYNKLFEAYYSETYGKQVDVIQSHGGSGGQARSVIEGAGADVVTLALAHDITLIQKAGLMKPDWINAFKENSSPYTSTIVFLVRKGNEKGIKDWDDLVTDGVKIINPDPKSSGGACWNFLAAWNYADEKFSGDETRMKDFLSRLYSNVTVMDSGARGATTTFVENGQGDVLIAWENEAIMAVSEYPDQYEIVSPSVSILAQPSVAIVDENADKNHTREVSKEYLEHLYTPEAQHLIGEYGYRPSDQGILKEFSDKFDLNMKLCTIDDFGGWDAVYERFFVDGGIFDEIYEN